MAETEIKSINGRPIADTTARKNKADKTGWGANKYIGTDENGNLVEKDLPETGTGGITQETDPTVPSWAKQPEKPTYTKTEIGLDNVDNVRQYSTSNPPPYPVIVIPYGDTTYSFAELHEKASSGVVIGVYNSNAYTAWMYAYDNDTIRFDSYTATTRTIISYGSDGTWETRQLTAGSLVKEFYYGQNVSFDDILSEADSGDTIFLYNVPSVDGITGTTGVFAGIDNSTKTAVFFADIANGKRVICKLIDTTWSYEVEDKLTAAIIETALGYTPANANDVPAVDNTLKVTGAAADAAKVGEEISNLSDKIDNLQSQGVQQTPSYAESIDWLNENGDTSKLYVLPDGYIYNYTTKTVVTEPTNRVPLSINADKTSFENGKGWKTGCTLSAGDGSERTDYFYYEVSGFISVTAHDTFCIKNFEWASPYNTYDNITFYDSSFNYIGAFTGSSLYNPLPQFLKDDGTFEACIATAATTNFSDTQKNSIAYIRLAFKEISDNTILTINEPLETTTTTITGWHSTGHAFVPADYEEDIIDLNRRVSVLEVGGTGTTIENYIVEEAERVAKNVYSHQNANTFTFLAISDMHYIENYSNVAQSIIHAGQGMDLVRKNVNVDFAVCLGDNGWGSGVEGSEYRATIEKGIEELRSANACIDSAFRGIPNFRSVGNHCSLIFNYTFNNNDYLDASELFPLYGAYNRGAVFPVERERGYCYRDFEDWKLRVICMNTSDLKDLTLPDDMQKPVYVSGTQGKWFAETLDLSGKNDAEEWSILILSHAPLDWGSSCIYLCDILKAYKEGSSGSIERNGITISYDYAGKNAATIIGNCHGHNHNFQVDYLRRYVGDNTTEAIDIKRFGIPNACFDRTNEKGENDTTEVWDIEYGETTSYEKVAGTAQDTAFCVVTIDPVERKIYADCYGAGYDREIEY